jgi:hypothetical protein
MKLTSTLLYISSTIPLVYAYQSETTIFFNTQSQGEYSAKLMYFQDGKQAKSFSYWSESSYCYPGGTPERNATLAKGASCDNLPVYNYFDAATIKAGETVRVAIEVPEYKLDVGHYHGSNSAESC